MPSIGGEPPLKPIQQAEPQQLRFDNGTTFNEPIARLSASAYNSAAFNEHDNVWIWGGNQNYKLGVNKVAPT